MAPSPTVLLVGKEAIGIPIRLQMFLDDVICQAVTLGKKRQQSSFECFGHMSLNVFVIFIEGIYIYIFGHIWTQCSPTLL